MVTIEFRDGERDVPEHVAMLLDDIETHKFTYEQAVRLGEQSLLRKRLNEAQSKLVATHMREFGR